MPPFSLTRRTSKCAGYSRPIQRGRGLLAQCFVRPFVVVLLAEFVEANLLGSQIPARRTLRLAFQRSVHALMAAVLLRVCRLDQLRENAQPNPPHRQRRWPS